MRPVSLSSFFGPLEIQVLESLWQVRREATVRDLSEFFPGVAYTTLMTTLDRLYKKGVLSRRKAGRAFLYAPVASREGLEQILAAEALDAILGSFGSGSSIRPLLSSFVAAVSRRDGIFLDELEELVRARRRESNEEEAS
jgi:predicted transcriptional regulator